MGKSKRKRERKLKPSLREKKRYILLKEEDEEKVKKAILDYAGILGFAKASPQFVRGKEGVLSINREGVDAVKAALELENIGVVKVSGTLKNL